MRRRSIIFRGSSPWIAIRNLRLQPAIARSGQDAASALTIASTKASKFLRSDVVGFFPNEEATSRLLGAILPKQNDEPFVQRAGYMTLESVPPDRR